MSAKESDMAYFNRRASEERSAAARAVNELARDYHVQMAESFAELATSILARQTQFTSSSSDQ